jgi:hypothetical protein
MMHWLSARFHGDEDNIRASWSIIYMFDMTRIEYAAELILTAAIPGVISSSTAQLTSDMSAITRFSWKEKISSGRQRWKFGRLLWVRREKDGRDDGVSHRSKALAFLSFNISGIGQVTC